MFELPRIVIKSGRMIIEHGEIRDPFIGKTLHVAPDYDRDVEADIQAWFEKYYSIRWRNYPVDDSYLHDAELVPAGSVNSRDSRPFLSLAARYKITQRTVSFWDVLSKK